MKSPMRSEIVTRDLEFIDLLLNSVKNREVCDIFGKKFLVEKVAKERSGGVAVLVEVQVAQVTREVPWNGAGLPPVGAKVILSDANHDVFEHYKEMIGVEVTVVASFASPAGFDMIACARPDGLCGYFRADMARPIRTPEQIAAEEREKAVDEMMAAHEPWIATRRFCEKLYDAGYRRQEPKE